MHLQAKALYNLLRSNWLQDPSLQVKSWQVEDYRSLETNELFKRLAVLGVKVDSKSFFVFAQNCETPEDLIDFLWIKEEDVEGYDQAYLILFELWRRNFSDTTALSIFCDELDYRIDLYEKEALTSEDALDVILKDLEDLLDEEVDRGLKPAEAFRIVSTYLAHDFQSFIYDYIAEQLDNENGMGASELIEGFYDYIEEKKWFDFLRARLIFLGDPENGSPLFSKIIEDLESKDLDLLFEIAEFLSDGRDPFLFLSVSIKLLKFIENMEDFQEILDLSVKFYETLSEKENETKLRQILSKQSLKQTFSITDPDLVEVNSLFNSHLQQLSK